MTFDFTNKKVPVFTGINDSPIAPTSTAAGNGSHLVGQHNGLIDGVEDALNALAPYQHTHWHEDSVVVTGNSFNIFVNSNIRHSTGVFQDPAAINDSFKFYAVLAAGNYRVTLLALGNNDCGRLTMYLDDVAQLGNFNLYRASITYNLLLTLDFTIATSGRHGIKPR